MPNTMVCPKHKYELFISRKKVDFAGTSYDVNVGKCPKCSVMYIGMKFLSSSTMTIAGQKYEYLSGLQKITDLHSGENIKAPVQPGKKVQKIDDIAQYFLQAEKEEYKREENERLKEENDSLKQQLESVQKALNEIEDRYRQEIQALKEMQKQEIEEIVKEHQARIGRINKINQERVDELQSALKTEQLIKAAYLEEKNKFAKQVEKLTDELAELKKPTRKVLFVDKKLYVCGGTIKCEKENHRREDVTGIIDTLKGATVQMTVCNCKDCNLYFVHDTVFESYREKYGTLLGMFVRKNSGMLLGYAANYGELAPESILHMNGYNVNQTENLTPEKRHKILAYVIESGIMTKAEIRNHLSYLIKMNQFNAIKYEAVSRWKADIQWVNDYHADYQNLVWLKGTAMYQYWKK